MNPTTKQVLLGALAIVGVDLALVLLLVLVARYGSGLPSVLLFTIGLVQLLWVVPSAIWAYRSGRKGLGHGILIGAALVLLVNGGCFALVMLSLDGMG